MRRLSLFLIPILFFSCSDQPEAVSKLPEMDRRTKLRFTQYYRQGKKLYQTYCQNCHMENGQGLKNLIPSLVGDSVVINQETVPCLIKYGIEGSGPQPMPAHLRMSNLEIAEIVTYISNSWGHASGLLEVKKVDRLMKKCQVRLPASQ